MFGLACSTPIGSGQKLCRLEILISPASTASRMPGSRLMRMPWLNSAWSKPSSRISRNIARPSVWRCEFQQLDNEYIELLPSDHWRQITASLKQKAGCSGTTPGHEHSRQKLQIGVARAKHSRKAGCFHLA